MKNAISALVAMVAFVLVNLLHLNTASAAPLALLGTSGFAPMSVSEEPGTYPPKITLYGGYTFDGGLNWQYARLVSTNGFATPGAFNLISGPSYASSTDYQSFAACPPGKSCGGYQAYYLTEESPPHLYRCVTFSGSAVSGCTELTTLGFAAMANGIGFTTDGKKLLLTAAMPADTKGQIYSVDTTSLAVFKLNLCGDSSFNTILRGVTDKYLYVKYNSKTYRFTWNGTNCSGARQLITAALGWDDNVGTSTAWGTFGNLSGTAYIYDTLLNTKYSTKNASCNDSYISASEKCDPGVSVAVDPLLPLNDQTCTSSLTGGPSGFSGGTLKCDIFTCAWDTSTCSAPLTCGNGSIDGTEECDSSASPAFKPGDTCASKAGAGYTGSLTCDGSCKISTGTCVPPAPVCGDGSINGTEECDSSASPAFKPGDTCASKTGVPGETGSLTCDLVTCKVSTSSCVAPAPVCGNAIKEAGEDCDGDSTVPPGLLCSTVKGAGWTGSVTKCTPGPGGCTFDTSACIAPPACGDSMINGIEECDSSASPAFKPGDTCASKAGVGYTGALTCDLVTCKISTGSCVAPVSCGNGIKDPGEECEGLDVGGKTCGDIKPGYTGTLKCNPSGSPGGCTFDTSACIAPVCAVQKTVPADACSVDCTDPNNPKVNVDGDCHISYLPKGAVTAALLKLKTLVSKSYTIPVATLPAHTKVNVPVGLDHIEVVDNGNHYGLAAGSAFELAVDGTTYTAIWLTGTTIRVECTEGKILLKFGGLPFPGITISGELPAVIPAGYGVEVDVFSGTTTKAPYKLVPDPPDAGPDGGDAGDAGSDADSGSDADAGLDAGADSGMDSGPAADAGPDGADSGGPPDPVAPGDPGGCHCTAAGHNSSGALALLGLICLGILTMRRRR